MQVWTAELLAFSKVGSIVTQLKEATNTAMFPVDLSVFLATLSEEIVASHKNDGSLQARICEALIKELAA